MVPTDNNWQPLLTDEDEPIVNHDTLTALIAADPQTVRNRGVVLVDPQRSQALAGFD
jgi:hypothetical protein